MSSGVYDMTSATRAASQMLSRDHAASAKAGAGEGCDYRMDSQANRKGRGDTGEET